MVCSCMERAPRHFYMSTRGAIGAASLTAQHANKDWWPDTVHSRLGSAPAWKEMARSPARLHMDRTAQFPGQQHTATVWPASHLATLDSQPKWAGVYLQPSGASGRGAEEGSYSRLWNQSEMP